MCLPALAAVGAIASVAGSVVSGMGAKSQADAQANQAEYNAKVARINAQSERYKGGVEQERVQEKAEQLQGQGLAAAGGSGIDPYFGSAALVIFGEGGEKAQLDKNTAYVNAEGAAIANENKARDLETQAQGYRQAGKYSMAGSFLSGLAGGVGALGRGMSGGGGLPSLGGGQA